MLNHSYTLPGIGSYVAAAVVARDFRALGWAIVTMTVLILLIDQFFWRLLVAWGGPLQAGTHRRRRSPLLAAGTLPVRARHLRAHRAFRAPNRSGRWRAHPFHRHSQAASQTRFRQSREGHRLHHRACPRRHCIATCRATLHLCAGRPVRSGKRGVAGLSDVGSRLRATHLRHRGLDPIGVAIGFDPKLSRLAQPVVQLLASFPANFVFLSPSPGFSRSASP